MGTVRHRAAPHPDRVNRAKAGCVKYSNERPEARPRLGRAIAVLGGTALVAFAAVGGLLIWHIMRRGRLIRERLSDPRVIRLPEFPVKEIDRES